MGFAINKERLQTLNRRLAILDEKAKILTYTHFRDRLQYEILRAKEFTHPLSIIKHTGKFTGKKQERNYI